MFCTGIVNFNPLLLGRSRCVHNFIYNQIAFELIYCNAVNFKESVIILGVFILGIVIGISVMKKPRVQEQSSVSSEPISIIDTHLHTSLSPSDRTNEAMGQAIANELLAKMDRYDIGQAIVMPPPQGPDQRAVYTYTALSSIVATNRDRLLLGGGGGDLSMMIFSTDPEDVTDTLKNEFRSIAEAIVSTGAVSFGEMAVLHLCLDPNHVYLVTQADHPLYLLLTDVSAETGVPIDVHMEVLTKNASTPKRFLDVCDQNPEMLLENFSGFERLLDHNLQAKIVLQHVGSDNLGNWDPTLLRTTLAKHPNLFVSLRVPDLYFTNSSRPSTLTLIDSDGTINSEWLALLEDFQDRFMVGSDTFTSLPGAQTPMDFPSGFSGLQKFIELLPDDLAKKIGHDNATVIYPIE